MNGVPLITSEFSIRDIHEITVVDNSIAELGFQQAWAFQPCFNLINSVLVDQLELYFDQPLTIDSTTLPANANILADPTFRKHILIDHYVERSSSDVYISFDSVFFYPPIFSDGPMNIRLKTFTDSGLTFESENDVILDLQ